MQYDARISTELYPVRDGAYRRARARLLALAAHYYDFRGRTVLDVGCGRGYFALHLASMGARVHAFDADAEKIARAREVAHRLGIQGIQFECGMITKDRIGSLPQFDAVLFLSVLHHLIGESGVYRWNEGVRGVQVGIDVLSDLAELANTVLFEMGDVPQADAPQPVWIPQRLLQPAGFTRIEVIPPPKFRGLAGPIRRVIHEALSADFGSKRNRGVLSRAARRLGYDSRDGRYLFVASRSGGSVVQSVAAGEAAK
jgi:SAM-dependent methyltransferase